MGWLIALLVIDTLLILSVIIYGYYFNKKMMAWAQEKEEKMNVCISMAARRVDEWEEEISNIQKQTVALLTRLVTVCDEANRLVAKASVPYSAEEKSLQEKELEKMVAENKVYFEKKQSNNPQDVPLKLIQSQIS